MLLRFPGLLTLAVSLQIVAGCASPPPPPKPAVIQTSISAAAGTNPDSRGRASPVVVKLYELNSLAAFESADFFSLFEKDKETLGAELVARQDLQVQPNEQSRFERTLQMNTRYIGVIAAFRDLERAKWRAVIAVPPEKVMPLSIDIDAKSISMSSK